MGIHDRPYWKEEQHTGYGGGGGGLRLGLPKPPPAVKWLLIVNIAVFLVEIFIGRSMVSAFAVIAGKWWEVWRYLTFQFLHGGAMHLGFNMLGLYFLGMIIERSWGTGRFLWFYLICGAFAGLAHVVLSLIFGSEIFTPLLGASGGVYAVVVACAILFPHIRVIVFLFPMSIRAAALLFLGIAVVSVLMGISSALKGGALSGGISHVAHLGGAVAAGVWIWLVPRLRGQIGEGRVRVNRGAWRSKMERRRTEQEEIDRILDKIRREGINSLSRREREKLSKATRRQHREDRELRNL